MQKDLSALEAGEKFRSLVKEITVCMFISDPDLGQTARPMVTVQIEDDLTLWFITDRNSLKMQEIGNDDQVHLIYAHPGKEAFLDVWGDASIIEDRLKVDELWSATMKAWFPEGKDDPNLCLIQVIPQTAHYWDSISNKMIAFFQMVAAGVTGKKTSIGESGELKL